MAEIDLLVETDRWGALDLASLAQKACQATLDHFSLSQAFEISVLACDDARIAALNTRFREKPASTNVLSWPSTERAPASPGAHPPPPDAGDPSQLELGDIAIAYETCTREASQADKPLADHVTHLLVHSTLHLLGYDHINDADAAMMESLEAVILANLGLPDPYSED